MQCGNDNAWSSSSSAGLYMEDNKFVFYSNGTFNFQTNRTFEDTSKWYHILVDNNYGESTDKIKIYIDGDLHNLSF